MSQTTDTTLADQSGASFRSELNNIISALNTDFSGSTAPVTPEAYMVWQDTSVTPNVLRRRNGANSAWEVYPVVEGATNAAAAKTTPVDADVFPLGDSAASFGLKKLSWLNIKAALKTYFDTLYLSLSGGTLTGLLKFANGTDIASASTVNLSTATGNTVKITGTTGISAWTMTSGQVMDVIFTGVLTLTHNATTNNLPSAVNITTAANDRARYFYDGTTVYCLSYQRADGTALAGVTFASSAENAAGTIENKAVDPLGIREAFNAGGSAPVYACRAWVNFSGSGTVTIRASGNVSSITDNGVGDYTVNFSTAMPDANYSVYGCAQETQTSTTVGNLIFPTNTATTWSAGSFRFRTSRTSNFVDVQDSTTINITVNR